MRYRPVFRQPFPHYGKCSGAEKDPRGKIGLEDRVHPEVHIPHIIFKVEQFTEDKNPQAEEGEETRKIEIFCVTIRPQISGITAIAAAI